jgi:hypothetical protein
MRFLILGRFSGANVPTAAQLDIILRELGATVLDKPKALRIMRSHKLTPHCYVVLKDDKELMLGTTPPSGSKKTIIKQTALTCRIFAGGDFKFIKWNYITSVKQTGRLEDPSAFLLQPGPCNVPNKVSDKRPLFVRQCTQKAGTEQIVSTSTSVKRSRNE